MPLKLGSCTAVLEGTVSVEDAEPLTAWLRTTPDAWVDLQDCTHLHTAALQALMVAGAQVSVAPVDPFLRMWIASTLEHLREVECAFASVTTPGSAEEPG